MALARKPKPQTKTEAPKDERAIEALISKGGSVAETAAKDKERAGGKSTNVVLRLPPEMLARVDEAVEARSLRIPRHTWLLEAVLEKLDREQSD
ncbi:MAG TPA: hypothetical protein DFI00_02835 [Rhodospirillaceae bacterium]|nr:hypothetical protein [Alphaproteobacteria bacterium]MBN56242.1 hypothetical protein [Oceanospirillaceae bacterium]OUT40349.1 MAG: hypothetical protein CBB62_10200 [Micavibrio sp. TMED2]HCI46210.1 hypothetical protein [Rhodospirillaceae bacterium]MAS47974.1 hypothetical protein [Alphaproteobacteria bacterium]|tara:strand:- start:6747 stop:7028 length:282 start_codon:yes stop_codon:yes gene_type:complete